MPRANGNVHMSTIAKFLKRKFENNKNGVNFNFSYSPIFASIIKIDVPHHNANMNQIKRILFC